MNRFFSCSFLRILYKTLMAFVVCLFFCNVQSVKAQDTTNEIVGTPLDENCINNYCEVTNGIYCMIVPAGYIVTTPGETAVSLKSLSNNSSYNNLYTKQHIVCYGSGLNDDISTSEVYLEQIWWQYPDTRITYVDENGVVFFSTPEKCVITYVKGDISEDFIDTFYEGNINNFCYQGRLIGQCDSGEIINPDTTEEHTSPQQCVVYKDGSVLGKLNFYTLGNDGTALDDIDNPVYNNVGAVLYYDISDPHTLTNIYNTNTAIEDYPYASFQNDLVHFSTIAGQYPDFALFTNYKPTDFDNPNLSIDEFLDNYSDGYVFCFDDGSSYCSGLSSHDRFIYFSDYSTVVGTLSQTNYTENYYFNPYMTEMGGGGGGGTTSSCSTGYHVSGNTCVANTYTITFNGNEATSGTTASVFCTYGSNCTLTTNGFTRTGYTFTGWNTAADGTGTSYTNGASVNNLTSTNGATVTLYAQWEELPTWDLNLYVEGDIYDTITVSYDTDLSQLNIPEGDITNGRYDVRGYDGDIQDIRHGGLTVVCGESLYGSCGSYDSGCKVLALEEGTQYTNDYWVCFDSIAAYDASSYGISEPFMDWYDEGTIDVTANLDPIPYNIDYYAYRDEIKNLTGNAPAGYSYGTAVTITARPPEKTGYTFAGWCSNDALTGDCPLDPVISATTTGDKEFYAKWTATSITCYTGTYLPANSIECELCISGNYCEEGTYSYSETEPQGLIPCPTDYPNSKEGSSIITQCYTGCTKACDNPVTCFIDNVSNCTYVSTNTIGIKYYGSNACPAESSICGVNDISCKEGYYYKEGVNVANIIGNMDGNNVAYIDNSSSFNELELISVEMSNTSNKGQSYYKITNKNEFAVDFGNKGIITGLGICSTQAGTNNNMTWQNPTIVNSLMNETGQTGAINCYCKLTGYIPFGGKKQQLSSDWVFFSSDSGYCAEYCSAYCSNLARATYTEINYKAFRSVLFDSAGVTTPTCEANTYKIEFNGNDATSGSTESVMCTYGSDCTLTENGFTRTGYTFTGWNTKADGTGTSYTDGTSVNNLTSTHNETVTLYAQWTPKLYNITYNLNDGINYANAPTSYTIESNTITFNTPTKDGYVFEGWYSNSEFTGEPITTLSQGSTGNKILYAKWNTIFCPAGQYKVNNVCTICPNDNYCPGDNTKVNCPEGLVSTEGRSTIDECGKILHVDEDILYLTSKRQTLPALAVLLDGNVYYGRMRPASQGRVSINSDTEVSLKANVAGTEYYIHDNSITTGE